MIGLETFDLNQIGLLFLLVSALSVIREKRIIPYLIVVLGSLTHGWFTVLLLVGLILIDRIHTQRSKWLLLTNAVGLAALVGASVLGNFYQTIFLVFGLLMVSVHLRQGGLGVVPALALTHQFFPSHGDFEIILAAAAFYLVLEEVLRLAKIKNVDSIMAWIELPIVLAVFYPFKEYILKIVDNPQALTVLAGSLLVAAVVSGLVFGKKIGFDKMVRGIYSRGARMYKGFNRSFGEGQGWIQAAKSATAVVDGEFKFFFWSALSILAAWVILIVVIRGRIG